jgi:fructose-specific phosphotransferase system IIC component
MGKSFILSVLFACVLGILIAWIDAQPNWDDSGISAFMVLLVSMLAAYLAKRKPWLIALAVGFWIPLYGIISTQNFGSLLALLPGIIGAYTGWWIEKILKTE